MIVTKDNERLYPATWEYNAARVITRLALVIENYGGRVKYGKNAVISNRSIDNAIIEKQSRIERLKELNALNNLTANEEKRDAVIKSLAQDIEELKTLNNEPLTVTHTSYISFIFNDFYYYFQVDSNPFFPFYYSKTPVNGDRYSKDAALQESKKEWLYECLLSWTCNDSEIKEIANLIFNELCSASASPIIRDHKKQRVSNTYNTGYHYEIIYAPERIATIDF